MLKVVILFLCISIITAYEYEQSDPLHWWDTDNFKEQKEKSNKRVPFPECLMSGSNSNYLGASSLQRIFDRKLHDMKESLKHEWQQNSYNENYGVVDYDANDPRGGGKSRAVVAATLDVTRDILTTLACDLNETDSDNLEHFLHKFKIPEKFCTYRNQKDCSKHHDYRTITGVCNNLNRTYEGSAQTAFARLTKADYADFLSVPRTKSRKGGLLPSCREISLALGTKPLFDRQINNFFVTWGQFIAHDMALSTPVTDTYLTPISTCTCDSKQDHNKCTVIDVAPNDPYFSGQKCMAFPATAQAFKNEICTLGVKEQMNGNTHYLDASVLYGSTDTVADAIRSRNGRLKSTRRDSLKYEILPGQREGKSCSDAKPDKPCLTSGDSRSLISLVFAAVETIFLRLHNIFARNLHELNPDWSDQMLYDEARKIVIGYYQHITYTEWLPTLFGKNAFEKYIGSTKIPSKYHPNVPGVIFTESATGAFRKHSICRDLYSRCDPSGERIDEIWFVDINHKVELAYDYKNFGLDAFACGSFYDYAFAFDGNIAHQLKNRLFETKTKYNQYWRNDLVAIDICRGREHGVPPYNVLRKHCGLPKAYRFEHFADTINYDGIKLLERLYKDVDDVDTMVALILEDPLPDSIIGPVSACILGKQFQVLRDGDRFFYSHEHVFKPKQLKEITSYPFYCFLCKGLHIERLPLFPFVPPNFKQNKLQKCSECPDFNLKPWKDHGDDAGDDVGDDDGSLPTPSLVVVVDKDS